MPASAPRYDPRILAAVRRLDDDCQSIAETCRRVGETASELGLPRPSYVHLRRIVKADREIRRARRRIAGDLLSDVARGMAPRIDRALEQMHEAKSRAEQHRAS